MCTSKRRGKGMDFNMIIDVIDLNFQTLQFRRRYDPNRYKRGTTLYNSGRAEIEKVEKIDDEN